LTVVHAEAMVEVLREPGLYDVTGGSPPTLAELRQRYAAQVAGPDRADEVWLNWIVTLHGGPVGFVQATVTRARGTWTADVAWVVATAHQGHGIATEAAAAVLHALAQQGTHRVTAHVAAGHAASEEVARRIGLRLTRRREHGERVWAALLDPPSW
jgi:RimJ/RimL family protein N-acetyltransferase